MKKFIFFLCLLSCSQTANDEQLSFEQIDTARPFETIAEKSDKFSSSENIVSTLPGPSITSTSTTMNSEEIAVRFQEIIEPYLATNITEIAEPDYFVNIYSFKFEEKIYTISNNFETDTSYCNYLDYQYNDPLLNSYNLYIFELEHSMMNKNSIAITYACKKHNGYGQDLYYDYIFKVDNQCYIYKNLNLIEYLEEKISEESLQIVTMFLDSQPNSIFLKPIKILYSGNLSDKCEKSLLDFVDSNSNNNVEVLEVTKQSIDFCCENIPKEDLAFENGYYSVVYYTLLDFEYCIDEINSLISEIGNTYNFDLYFPGEYYNEWIYYKITLYGGGIDFILKLEITQDIIHVPGGVPWYYLWNSEYIFNQNCDLIYDNEDSFELFKQSKAVNLTALSSIVMESFDYWLEEFNYVNELIRSEEFNYQDDIYIPFEYNKGTVVFDLTGKIFFKNLPTESFNCNFITSSYNLENFWHFPTYNYFRPMVYSVSIYELLKVGNLNLNLNLKKYSECREFSVNNY